MTAMGHGRDQIQYLTIGGNRDGTVLAYRIEVLGRGGRAPTPEELKHFYSLYQNVKARSLRFNTFELPEDLFEKTIVRRFIVAI